MGTGKARQSLSGDGSLSREMCFILTNALVQVAQSLEEPGGKVKRVVGCTARAGIGNDGLGGSSGSSVGDG